MAFVIYILKYLSKSSTAVHSKRAVLMLFVYCCSCRSFRFVCFLYVNAVLIFFSCLPMRKRASWLAFIFVFVWLLLISVSSQRYHELVWGLRLTQFLVIFTCPLAEFFVAYGMTKIVFYMCK